MSLIQHNHNVPQLPQLVNYLKATGIEVGLLINFGESVQIMRKILDTLAASRIAVPDESKT